MTATGGSASLGWGGIVRLGLVQAAIGSIVVLATSTMNRVMIVELAMPASFPGLLVALHYFVQMARTRVGHGSDVGGRLTSWIVAGMVVLALGGVGAAASIGLMAVNRRAGMGAAIVAFLLIGLGVGACGTSLLVLLARSVDAARRPAAATITWLMMFVGFVTTTAVVGQLLAPYSHARLLVVTAGVASICVLMTVVAIWHMERAAMGASASAAPGVSPALGPAPTPGPGGTPMPAAGVNFRSALRQVWNEPAARQFTVFVFISMLAYSGQELLLEPFAGRVYGLSPAGSASLVSLQHGGALAGMLMVAVLGTIPARLRITSLRGWTIGGCAASAFALASLVASAFAPTSWPLRANLFILGVANGVFAVAAIGSMMSLVSAGGPARHGIRMGLWGAAQALAFALGGAVSSTAVDVVQHFLGTPATAYAAVFSAQAVMFLVASAVAGSVGAVAVPIMNLRPTPDVFASHRSI